MLLLSTVVIKRYLQTHTKMVFTVSKDFIFGRYIENIFRNNYLFKKPFGAFFKQACTHLQASHSGRSSSVIGLISVLVFKKTHWHIFWYTIVSVCWFGEENAWTVKINYTDGKV